MDTKPTGTLIHLNFLKIVHKTALVLTLHKQLELRITLCIRQEAAAKGGGSRSNSQAIMLLESLCSCHLYASQIFIIQIHQILSEKHKKYIFTVVLVTQLVTKLEKHSVYASSVALLSDILVIFFLYITLGLDFGFNYP